MTLKLSGWLRRPPYNVSRWEWYVAPWLEHVGRRLRWWICTECGMRRQHKMQCSTAWRRQE